MGGVAGGFSPVTVFQTRELAMVTKQDGQRRAAVGTELLAGRVLGPARGAAHGRRRAAVAAELLPLQVGRAAARALHAAPD